MTFQSKANIWDSIQPDFNHMQINSTIGGAITDFDFLLRKLRTIPSVIEVIIQIENQIAVETKRRLKHMKRP